MKSNVSALAPLRLLVGQRLRGVLAHELDAGLGERAHQLRAARTWSRPAARPRRGRGRPARRRGRRARAPPRGSRARARARGASTSSSHIEPGLAAGDAAVAAVREEPLGVAARAEAAVGEPAPRPRRSARARARPRRPGRACRRRAPRRACPRRSNVARHLGADLVAAGADSRAERRVHVARSRIRPGARPPRPRSRSRPRRFRATRSAPSRPRPGAREREREAVGDQHERRQRPARCGHLRVRGHGRDPPGAARSCTCTSAPWTWRPITIRRRSRPSARASARRFARTRPRSSSVRIPRLSESYGAALTPPRRVLNAAARAGQRRLEPRDALRLPPRECRARRRGVTGSRAARRRSARAARTRSARGRRSAARRPCATAEPPRRSSTSSLMLGDLGVVAVGQLAVGVVVGDADEVLRPRA